MSQTEKNVKQIPDIIVTDDYLMNELNLTRQFINYHARAMGSFGRPRRFFLKHVMAHLENLARKSIQKSYNRHYVSKNTRNRIVQLARLSLEAKRDRT